MLGSISDQTQNAWMNGAEVIALVLGEYGVELAFAYPGTSELALCDAIEASGTTKLRNSRGDKEAAFMAAGGSLLRPNRAIAVLHGARGATNALGAIADAQRTEAGTLFLVGMPTSSSAPFLPPHGETDLIEHLGAFTGWAAAVPGPAEVADGGERGRMLINALTRALDRSSSLPHRPSLVGVPQDLLELRDIPASVLDQHSDRDRNAGSWTSGSDAAPSQDGLERAVYLSCHSRRPVILIDDYALRVPDMTPAINELSTALKAPVFQVRYRRGPMLFERLSHELVPNFAGWLNQFAPEHLAVLRAADLLVTVEDRNMYERVVGPLPRCVVVALNTDPAKVAKNLYLKSGDVVVAGNPADSARVLAAGMLAAWSAADERVDEALPDVIRLRECAMTTTESATPLVIANRRRLVRELSAAMDRSAQPILVDDSQMFGGLIAEGYDLLPVGLRVFGGHGGFVGGGLPTALGLAATNPESTVFCTLGDQAFTNSLQALAFASESRPDLTIFVCNNGESVSLQKQGLASIGRRDRGYLGNVPSLSYTGIARGMGIPADRVELDLSSRGMSTAVLAAALHEQVSGPRLFELVVPSTLECWRGIWMTQGFESLQEADAALPPPKN